VLFFSVVRYNSQRWGTARSSNFFLFIVMYVPFSVVSVLFVCKCVLYCCQRVSTQLQLKINIIYNICSDYSLRIPVMLKMSYHKHFCIFGDRERLSADEGTLLELLLYYRDASVP
jgi:hypothetical protein